MSSSRVQVSTLKQQVREHYDTCCQTSPTEFLAVWPFWGDEIDRNDKRQDVPTHDYGHVQIRRRRNDARNASSTVGAWITTDSAYNNKMCFVRMTIAESRPYLPLYPLKVRGLMTTNWIFWHVQRDRSCVAKTWHYIRVPWLLLTWRSQSRRDAARNRDKYWFQKKNKNITEMCRKNHFSEKS